MLKLLKVLLIVGILLTISNIGFCYEPLTDEEVTEYIKSLTWEELIIQIRMLDILEHEPPVFERYKYIAILNDKDELIVYPEKAEYKARHGHLYYTVQLPTFYFPDFEIPIKKNYVLAGISGGIIALYGSLITGEDVWWKYCISGAGGIGIGILVEYIFRK